MIFLIIQFLVQSKVLDPQKGFSRESDRARLMKQCRDLVNISSASYVATYSNSGIEFFSASSVIATGARSFENIHNYNSETFFFDFLRCWIGDARFKAASKTSLSELRRLIGVPDAALIRATESKERQ